MLYRLAITHESVFEILKVDLSKRSLRITLLWCCLIFCKMLFYPSLESTDKSKKVLLS